MARTSTSSNGSGSGNGSIRSSQSMAELLNLEGATVILASSSSGPTQSATATPSFPPKCHDSFHLFLSEDSFILQPLNGGSKLVINRETCDLSETDQRSEMILVSSSTYHGLLGFIDLGTGPHLLLIEASQMIGAINHHNIHVVRSVSAIRVQSVSHLLNKAQEQEEQEQLTALIELLQSGCFFYCQSHDLTRSLQRRSESAAIDPLESTKSLAAQADPIFFWNQHFSRPFISASLSFWITPIILGSVSMSSFEGAGEGFGCIIARCGVIHEAWSLALTPPIEIEQQFRWRDHVFSHVQRRGALPRLTITVENSEEALRTYLSSCAKQFESVEIVDAGSRETFFSTVINQSVTYSQQKLKDKVTTWSSQLLSEGLKKIIARFGFFRLDMSDDVASIQRGLLISVADNGHVPTLTRLQKWIGLYLIVLQLQSIEVNVDDETDIGSIIVNFFNALWDKHNDCAILYHRTWLSKQAMDYITKTSSETPPPPQAVALCVAYGLCGAKETLPLTLANLNIALKSVKDLEEQQSAAMLACAKSVLPVGETLIKAWPVISINKRDEEQDRVLLLTSSAYYRVKYNFRANTLEHFVRVQLEDIELLQKGLFNLDSGIYGFRIFSLLWRETESVAGKTLAQIQNERQREYVRTYAIQLPFGSETDRKVTTCEAVFCISQAYFALVGEKLKVVEERIDRQRSIWSAPTRSLRKKRTSVTAHSFLNKAY